MSFTAILLQLPVGHCFGVFAYVTDILATIGVALRHGETEKHYDTHSMWFSDDMMNMLLIYFITQTLL